MLLFRFFGEIKNDMPQDLINSCVDRDQFEENVIMVSKKLSKNYDKFKESIRNLFLGKTAQFWLIYLDLMEHNLGFI